MGDSIAFDQDEEDQCSIEQDPGLWSPLECRVSEEDRCLLRPTPNPLQSLPTVLRNCVNSSTTPHMNGDVLRSRLATRTNLVLELMGILFSYEAQTKLGPSCLGGSGDTPLFLDFAPMLGMMGSYERAALSVPDVDGGANSRRRTRKSARNGRSHYFESLNPTYDWGEENFWSASEKYVTMAFALFLFCNSRTNAYVWQIVSVEEGLKDLENF